MLLFFLIFLLRFQLKRTQLTGNFCELLFNSRNLKKEIKDYWGGGLSEREDVIRKCCCFVQHEPVSPQEWNWGCVVIWNHKRECICLPISGGRCCCWAKSHPRQSPFINPHHHQRQNSLVLKGVIRPLQWAAGIHTPQRLKCFTHCQLVEQPLLLFTQQLVTITLEIVQACHLCIYFYSFKWK